MIFHSEMLCLLAYFFCFPYKTQNKATQFQEMGCEIVYQVKEFQPSGIDQLWMMPVFLGNQS